jgi:putative membrane protein
MTRSPRAYLIIIAKGIAMGAADVVPGVSGGTIAFITGIYTELLASIKNVPVSLRNFAGHRNPGRLLTDSNSRFLGALLGGILLSVLSLSRLILYLLENHPVMLWSFFFGLIVASAIVVFGKVGRLTGVVIVSAVAGIGVAWYITATAPVQTPEALWFVFLSGFIAICAMILPGISGSFILLLLGKYEFILQSLKALQADVIATFAAGCIGGLLAFSHVLTFLLRRYHDLTVALLAGFMIGSLNKVWPWKVVTETYVNSHGELKPLLEKNLMPWQFQAATFEDPHLVATMALAVGGFLLVMVLERVGRVLSHDDMARP